MSSGYPCHVPHQTHSTNTKPFGATTTAPCSSISSSMAELHQPRHVSEVRYAKTSEFSVLAFKSKKAMKGKAKAAPKAKSKALFLDSYVTGGGGQA